VVVVMCFNTLRGSVSFFMETWYYVAYCMEISGDEVLPIIINLQNYQFSISNLLKHIVSMNAIDKGQNVSLD
jgi:hypothetical protein